MTFIGSVHGVSVPSSYDDGDAAYDEFVWRKMMEDTGEMCPKCHRTIQFPLRENALGQWLFKCVKCGANWFDLTGE